ncbi:uncharacterized protein LOC117781308 [Drosophila innubila]|uniref:uncharacterized protein LOC117781308 n=1 Tax=Drosophila innubila TaxID=198719 RepID=UPI00148D2FBA|nr:uncharacterized protein LOC117781308 [Drosophila innubila]
MELLRHCFFSLLLTISCALAEYMILVDQFNFVPEDRKLIISQSSFVEQDANRSYLSGHLVFSRSLNDIKLFTSMDIARPNFPRVRLFDKKLDVCSFFTNDYRSKFVRQIYNNYISYLNVVPSCPLKAHFNYSLHRGYVDDRYLPDFLPDCSFFIKFEFLYKSNQWPT